MRHESSWLRWWVRGGESKSLPRCRLVLRADRWDHNKSTSEEEAESRGRQNKSNPTPPKCQRPQETAASGRTADTIYRVTRRLALAVRFPQSRTPEEKESCLDEPNPSRLSHKDKRQFNTDASCLSPPEWPLGNEKVIAVINLRVCGALEQLRDQHRAKLITRVETLTCLHTDFTLNITWDSEGFRCTLLKNRSPAELAGASTEQAQRNLCSRPREVWDGGTDRPSAEIPKGAFLPKVQCNVLHSRQSLLLMFL